jgi:uncharacterized protein YrrD
LVDRRSVLQRYSEVLGKDVVSMPEGRKLGEVKELVFSPEKLEFAGIVFSKGSFGISERAVLREDILCIDKRVMLKNSACPRRIKRGRVGDMFKTPVTLKGLPVYAMKGGELGFIEDVFFDYRTGHVEKIELGDGIIHDVMDGRKLMPIIGKVEVAEEHMLVSQEAVEEMVESHGGIKKFLKEE